jgi:hypothetical protein
VDGYQEAYQRGREKLQELSPQQVAERGGGQWDEREKILIVFYLKEPCLIQYPEISFRNGESLTVKEKILIMHYLLNSREIPETGTLIGPKEIETGSIYYPSVVARVYRPLVEKFGRAPDEFLKKSLELNAWKSNFSEYAVKFTVFPRVKLLFVLRPEDAEFPADCQVLFDANISQLLDTEDIEGSGGGYKKWALSLFKKGVVGWRKQKG